MPLKVWRAILNAAAFTGSNYLAKYPSGDNGKAARDEKKKGEPLEAYEAAQARSAQERTKLLDWIETNH